VKDSFSSPGCLLRFCGLAHVTGREHKGEKKMNSRKGLFAMLAAIAFLALAMSTLAQDTSQTTTTEHHGQASKTVDVEQGEVVYVSGNDLVLKMADGEIRHVTAPPGATAVVDGKTISIKDVVPGMKLQRTITTTSTPQTVTTVRTINGKVWFVQAPSRVILTLPDNTNKEYKVPKDQVFMVNGEKKTVWDLRKGMNISATVLTEVPETVVAQQKQVTGSMPPPPPTPPIVGVLLIETPAPAAPATVAEATPPAELPKTGSLLPLMGLFGILSMAGSLTLMLFRKLVS
jgi:LPXTG-motif cell wall-anchored protein